MTNRQKLIETYLDFFNNYLTISLFAEHRGLSEEQGKQLIELAKSVYNSKHPDE